MNIHIIFNKRKIKSNQISYLYIYINIVFQYVFCLITSIFRGRAMIRDEIAAVAAKTVGLLICLAECFSFIILIIFFCCCLFIKIRKFRRFIH